MTASITGNNAATKVNNNIASAIATHNNSSSAHSNKEDTSNKVTSISSNSTHTQFPSAKCMYDYINNIIGDIEEDMNL